MPPEDPSPPGHPPSDPSDVKRKLFFGVALVLAMGSMYAGILGAGSVIQYGLAIAAVIVVVVALGSGATKRP